LLQEHNNSALLAKKHAYKNGWMHVELAVHAEMMIGVHAASSYACNLLEVVHS
jgi:hypothetical protein